MTRELRFGATSGALFSSTWTVRAAANRPELYVAQRATGGFMHISLHDDPDYWHMKVRLATGDVTKAWPRPPPIGPGLTRALAIVVTPAVVDRPISTRRRQTTWIALVPNKWLEFNLLIEDATVSTSTWPGQRAMGTSLVGRIAMSNGSRACVTVHPIEPVIGKSTFPTPSQAERRRIRRGIARGNAYTLVQSMSADGAFTLIDARIAISNPIRRLWMRLFG
jgi:hypothetical protein